MQAIGLDIGTTSICGILIDAENGNIIRTITKANTSAIPSNLAFEKLQSPKIILDIVNDIMFELYEEAKNVGCIGITGQMHGILYTDANGNAVSPLYTWQDERGNLLYRDSKSYAQYLNSYTGYGNITDFYNRVNNLIPQNSKHFCTIHDYVAMKLTERKAPLVHASDAASFGLYDTENNRFTVDGPLLPNVTNNAEIVGHWNGIPVSVAIGDNQASFIGCGGNENSVLVNIGTGSQVSWISDIKKPPEGTEIRPLYEDKYLTVGSSLCGGRAYAALKSLFNAVIAMSGNSCDGLYEKMQAAGEMHEGTPPVFETLFCGTRNDERKKASITELTIDNFTPGNLVYSCLSGMANELYGMYQSNINHTELIGSGNGIRRNPLLKKIIEDRFKMKLKVPMHTEEASFGAAMFAMTAVGMYKMVELQKRILRYGD